MELSTIFQEFRQSLYSYIRSKVRTKEDAEDILQTVFLKLSLNLHSLSNKTRLKEWIFTITRNCIYDYYGQNARLKLDPIHDSLIKDFSTKEINSTYSMKLEQCLIEFIQQLPTEYREVIINSEIKGRQQKELAKLYNMPYSSLRSRVQRGRARLKQMLLQCCKVEQDARGGILDFEPKGNCGISNCKKC